ncbi:MAG: hypothetical protein ACREJ2_09350 [Planctomycetota bacterium]
MAATCRPVPTGQLRGLTLTELYVRSRTSAGDAGLIARLRQASPLRFAPVTTPGLRRQLTDWSVVWRRLRGWSWLQVWWGGVLPLLVFAVAASHLYQIGHPFDDLLPWPVFAAAYPMLMLLLWRVWKTARADHWAREAFDAWRRDLGRPLTLPECMAAYEAAGAHPHLAARLFTAKSVSDFDVAPVAPDRIARANALAAAIAESRRVVERNASALPAAPAVPPGPAPNPSAPAAEAMDAPVAGIAPVAPANEPYGGEAGMAVVRHAVTNSSVKPPPLAESPVFLTESTLPPSPVPMAASAPAAPAPVTERPVSAEDQTRACASEVAPRLPTVDLPASGPSDPPEPLAPVPTPVPTVASAVDGDHPPPEGALPPAESIATAPTVAASVTDVPSVASAAPIPASEIASASDAPSVRPAASMELSAPPAVIPPEECSVHAPSASVPVTVLRVAPGWRSSVELQFAAAQLKRPPAKVPQALKPPRATTRRLAGLASVTVSVVLAAMVLRNFRRAVEIYIVNTADTSATLYVDSERVGDLQPHWIDHFYMATPGRHEIELRSDSSHWVWRRSAEFQAGSYALNPDVPEWQFVWHVFRAPDHREMRSFYTEPSQGIIRLPRSPDSGPSQQPGSWIPEHPKPGVTYTWLELRENDKFLPQPDTGQPAVHPKAPVFETDPKTGDRIF